MSALKIIGLIFVIFGLMGLFVGTGPVWARWTLLIVGAVALAAGYMKQKPSSGQ